MPADGGPPPSAGHACLSRQPPIVRKVSSPAYVPLLRAPDHERVRFAIALLLVLFFSSLGIAATMDLGSAAGTRGGRDRPHLQPTSRRRRQPSAAPPNATARRPTGTGRNRRASLRPSPRRVKRGRRSGSTHRRSRLGPAAPSTAPPESARLPDAASGRDDDSPCAAGADAGARARACAEPRGSYAGRRRAAPAPVPAPEPIGDPGRRAASPATDDGATRRWRRRRCRGRRRWRRRRRRRLTRAEARVRSGRRLGGEPPAGPRAAPLRPGEPANADPRLAGRRLALATLASVLVTYQVLLVRLDQRINAELSRRPTS